MNLDFLHAAAVTLLVEAALVLGIFAGGVALLDHGAQQTVVQYAVDRAAP